jgi:hypothetical protein
MIFPMSSGTGFYAAITADAPAFIVRLPEIIL